MLEAVRRSDPRLYQITVLSGLLIYGILALDLEVRPLQAATTLAAALAAQALFTRLVGPGRFDPRSPLISALSLCLLLRTDHPALPAVAALAAVAGKFLIRLRGKHVFNPANFGLVAMMLATDRAWVSPGQWGSVALFGFLLACLGGLVIHRAERSDVTYAFVAAYGAVLFGRAWWLGDPLTIPFHQMQNGAFLIFAFFMISDPKTTPDTRAGRVAYAAVVALVAGYLQFALFVPGALIWSLALSAAAVPVIDLVLPGNRYAWKIGQRPERSPLMSRSLATSLIAAAALTALAASPARAFCGFYVAKADTGLFNRASNVVLVRDDDRTVISMASDYRGDPTEFALVVPVPTVLERGQIHVAEPAVIEHLDAYTAPRLVEYHDPNPCRIYELPRLKSSADAVQNEAVRGPEREQAAVLGVTIEARYSVGEYDILILSAKESAGLETWLVQNGYRLPSGARRVLGSYIRQGLKFFVAKVDLEEQERLGYTSLRPLQIAYESPRFMLPIRLGTVNADGPQELFIFALTRTGRVETTNYRTVKLPSDVELPTFVKDEFSDFYRAMFSRQVDRERRRAVFLEYAWDMSWCDPCAADPLSDRELRQLGVFWVGERPGDRRFKPQARDVFVTRLHLRYTGETFPEDLMFQETGDRTNFQGRYVLRHPFRGEANCAAADEYWRQVRERQEKEAENLASLTGWRLDEIRSRLDGPRKAGDEDEGEPWWKRIWGGR